MVLLLACPQHNLPRNRLCAFDHSCDLLCDHCLTHYFQRTHHTTAIYLNPQALLFFEQFTAFLHQVMLRWGQAVRRGGFGAVFAVESGEGSLSGSVSLWRDLSRLGVGVLEEHGRLMACNLSFATGNRDSPQLYHPEFLKDLFNLITQPWTTNAHLLLLKMNHHASTLSPIPLGTPIIFNFREELTVQIQKYRQELLEKWQGMLICDISDSKESSGKNRDTNDCSASSGQGISEGKEVSPFRLPSMPISIRVIESFEQIEPPMIDSKSIASTAPNMSISEEPQLHPPISMQRQKGDEGSGMKEEEGKLLKEEVERLLAENSLLKSEGASLLEQNRILQQKCEAIRIQRRGLPSSSKKYRQSDLNSEMVMEIVELQAQLNASRHDLQLLANFLNELSRRGVVPAHQLSRQMAALRTISIH